MKLSSAVIYTRDIRRTQDMFLRYFGAVAGEIVHDEALDTDSSFLTFPDGGELLFVTRPGLTDGSAYPLHTGYAGVTISVGSKEKVREITMQIYKDGYTVHNMPRTTAYGRWESVVLDFDGNFITIAE